MKKNELNRLNEKILQKSKFVEDLRSEISNTIVGQSDLIDKISPLSPIKGETEDIPPHNSTTFFLFQSFDSAKADSGGKIRISKIK